MSVGHGGDESKHSGEEKLFILEYLEARLNDVVDDYKATPNAKDVSIEVYDPYNTDMDFFVIVKADGNTFSETLAVYEEIYKKYQKSPIKKGGHEDKFNKAWGKKWGWNFDVPDLDVDETAQKNKKSFEDKKENIFGYDKFHASRSKTILFYSINQMAAMYGESRVYIVP